MKKFLHLFVCVLISQLAFALNTKATALPPTVTISYINSSMCHSATNASVVIMNGTGNYTGGTFSASPSGLFINPATGSIIPANSVSGIYVVTYTLPATQGDPTVTASTTITILGGPVLLPMPDVFACQSYMLPPLEAGYYFTEENQGGQMLEPGTIIEFTQLIYMYANTGDCTFESPFMVTISPMIVPTFNPVITICNGSVPPTLPTTSNNGITGTWLPATISNTSTGFYTFIPDQSLECASTANMMVIVQNCSGITLNTYLDIDADGIRDNGEPNFPLGQFHYEVNNDGIVHDILAPAGMHVISDNNLSNSYDLSYTIGTPNNANYNCTTSFLNISPTAPPQLYNFPVTVVNSHIDLNVTLVPVNAPRAGFSYQNTIVYTNNGNTAITSGTISFTHDGALSLISVSVSGTIPTASGFTYNFTNLGPFETRYIMVSMFVPPMPNVSINQPITTSVVGVAGESSDSSTLTQGVIASMDPNDKMECHGDKIPFPSFTSEDYLYYTIRFENTGNAPALEVRVSDVLDAKLDESTVQLVSASHSYELQKTGSNLTFVFNSINLAPSVSNTSIGKGYVTFKVKPDPGYAIGDIIPNMASIYFDSNPAIETNIFTTEFVAPLGTVGFEKSGFKMYPNPASGLLTIASEKAAISNIRIYDALGKVMLDKNTQSTYEQINIQSIAAGIYFVKIITAANSESVQKLIIK